MPEKNIYSQVPRSTQSSTPGRARRTNNAFQLYGGEGQSGTQARTIRNPSSPYVVRPPVQVITIDVGNTASFVDLPPVATDFYIDRTITIKKTDSGTSPIIVRPQFPPELIDGFFQTEVPQKGEVLVLEPVGTEWKTFNRTSMINETIRWRQVASGDYTIIPSIQFVVSTAQNATITLPRTVLYPNTPIRFKRTSALAGNTTIIVNNTTTDNIDGSNTVVLNVQNQAVELLSNAFAQTWHIVSKYL